MPNSRQDVCNHPAAKEDLRMTSDGRARTIVEAMSTLLKYWTFKSREAFSRMLARRVAIKLLPFVKDNLQMRHAGGLLSRMIHHDLKHLGWTIL